MSETFFNLTWLIPLFPLAAFAIIVLWTNRNRLLSTWVAWIGIGVAWILGWTVFGHAWASAGELTPPAGSHPVPLFTIPTGSTALQIGFHVDTLSGLMLFMVPFVCLMIFIYSKGYMNYGTEDVDPLYSRFFAYISLFACGMLGLVVSDNFVTFLVFWEIMGLCSYLLIGFWFDKTYPDPKRITPKEAGLKAFLTTRIGDVIMLAGILLLYSQTGTLTFREIFSEDILHQLATTYAFPGMPWATLCALLIFGGAVGKSSQFPLHVWLPDAMEGPTPVSALIHAATMVTAGVFMVARLSPLFELSTTALTFVTFIGATTAFFAATVGLVQNDIKRVIAYSTCSQLGYMFVALGVGAYGAGIFHLFTHAFFKALLFLGSGSVIHAVSDEQDMRRMGGLRTHIPITFWMMIVGTLALTGVGIPETVIGTAGFFSKDLIIESSFVSSNPMAGYAFVLLVIAAVFTSFYSWRLIFMTFFGKPRASADIMHHVHESPMVMLVPLFILAAGALFAGLLFYNDFFGHHYEEFWKTALYTGSDNHILEMVHETPFWAKVSPFVAMLLGFFTAWHFYIRSPDTPKRLAEQHDALYRFLLNKWYFDEIYDFLFVRPAKRLGYFLWKRGDGWLIDGFGPDGVAARVIDVTGRVVRLQTGYLYHYAFAMLIGVAALVTWMMLRGAL